MEERWKSVVERRWAQCPGSKRGWLFLPIRLPMRPRRWVSVLRQPSGTERAQEQAQPQAEGQEEPVSLPVECAPVRGWAFCWFHLASSRERAHQGQFREACFSCLVIVPAVPVGPGRNWMLEPAGWQIP